MTAWLCQLNLSTLHSILNRHLGVRQLTKHTCLQETRRQEEQKRSEGCQPRRGNDSCCRLHGISVRRKWLRLAIKRQRRQAQVSTRLQSSTLQYTCCCSSKPSVFCSRSVSFVVEAGRAECATCTLTSAPSPGCMRYELAQPLLHTKLTTRFLFY